jgi:hypothetical protein
MVLGVPRTVVVAGALDVEHIAGHPRRRRPVRDTSVN